MRCTDSMRRLLLHTTLPKTLSSRVTAVVASVSLIAALATIVVACSSSSQLPSDAAQVNASGRQCGPLHASGAEILNAQGNQVVLSGVNWFGFETESFAPHGLSVRNYQSMLNQMARVGFNT